MRVTYFIDSLASGGAQRQAVEIAGSLARRGMIEAHFLVYHPHDFHARRLAESGATLERIPRATVLDPRFPWRLRGRILASRADVVHAFMWSKAVWPALAMWGLGARRPRFVASERNSEVADTFSMKWLQRFAYGAADLVTANCEPVARQLEERLGLPAPKIRYLPNGLDLEMWDRAALEEPAPELEEGRIHLAVIGRVEPQKNHPLLIDAVARLPERLRSRISLWFLGWRPESAWVDALDARIRSAGLAEQVRFMGAVQEVGSWAARMHAVVLPSRHEGFPNVVIEAMAARVPVIVTDVGDVRNIVTPDCGTIVPEGDVEALASAVARIADLDEGQRRSLGQRGREIVEARFRIDPVADGYLALYRELCDSRTA